MDDQISAGGDHGVCADGAVEHRGGVEVVNLDLQVRAHSRLVEGRAGLAEPPGNAQAVIAIHILNTGFFIAVFFGVRTDNLFVGNGFPRLNNEAAKAVCRQLNIGVARRGIA